MAKFYSKTAFDPPVGLAAYPKKALSDHRGVIVAVIADMDHQGTADLFTYAKFGLNQIKGSHTTWSWKTESITASQGPLDSIRAKQRIGAIRETRRARRKKRALPSETNNSRAKCP